MGEEHRVVIDSPIGPLELRADEHGRLTEILFTEPGTQGPPPDQRVPTLLVPAATQLAEYFTGRRLIFDIPLAPAGTEFQRAAWNALTLIPYGTTRSYAQQAAILGRPRATRAVGAANGRNPLPLVVPCHRVIGTNGSLTGFGGGMDRKQWLLHHEQAVLARRGTPDHRPRIRGAARS